MSGFRLESPFLVVFLSFFLFVEKKGSSRRVWSRLMWFTHLQPSRLMCTQPFHCDNKLLWERSWSLVLVAFSEVGLFLWSSAVNCKSKGFSFVAYFVCGPALTLCYFTTNRVEVMFSCMLLGLVVRPFSHMMATRVINFITFSSLHSSSEYEDAISCMKLYLSRV